MVTPKKKYHALGTGVAPERRWEEGLVFFWPVGEEVRARDGPLRSGGLGHLRWSLAVSQRVTLGASPGLADSGSLFFVARSPRRHRWAFLRRKLRRAWRWLALVPR